MDQSIHFVVTACHSVHATPFYVNGNACNLQYNVDTMSQGHVWVSSIQNVIQSLQDIVKLETELQQEWNEEYIMLCGRKML